MTVDARGALCLVCRTALAPGETCDGGPHHKAVRLAEPAERAKALDRVWGPPHLRAKGVASATATGGGVGGLFEGCGGCGDLAGGGELGAVILVIVIAAIAFIAIWWISTRIAHAIRNHRARLRPQGAVALSTPRGSIAGTVTRGEAWGVELRHDDALGSKVMLRDGATSGLQITVDDGRVLEVPAGRARVFGDGEKIDGAAAARRVDPAYRDQDNHAVIPWDRAEEVKLAVGDRVELYGALDQRPDPNAREVGYRDAAASILMPAGVPWLRKV